MRRCPLFLLPLRSFIFCDSLSGFRYSKSFSIRASFEIIYGF